MGLKVFFLLRDKKYNEANKIAQSQKDSAYAVFLKVHILI